MQRAISREGESHHQSQGHCWERQPCVSSLSAPTQLHKNGPWAWNTSLPRDKEALQAVLGLLLCFGNIFLYFRPNLYHFVLFKYVSNGTWPTSTSVPYRWAWAPSMASRRDLLVMGDQGSSQKLLLLCVFLGLSKSVTSRDLLCWVYLVTPIPKCSRQENWW